MKLHLLCLISRTERKRVLWDASQEDYHLPPSGAHLLLPEPQEGAVIAVRTLPASGEVAEWILGPQHQLPAPIVSGRKEPGRELEPLQGQESRLF